MTSILLLGFLIGMRHALETDHVAAVASLATRCRSGHETIQQGIAWGVGHTITLFLFGSIVLLVDAIMPKLMAMSLEFAVGMMLVVLGVDVIWRILRENIHFHHHQHSDGIVHFHAHSHAREGKKEHNPNQHVHGHRRLFPRRALLVGMVHGMAGSAALILLTLQTVESVWMGVFYMAMFGVGSILGMASLSVMIAIPLQGSAKSLTWLHNGLQAVVGVATVLLGGFLMYEIGIVEGLVI